MNNLQYSYDKYNYWNIPLSELPTRGLFYNPNAKIKLRNLSVMEVKFLATYQPALATEICNEILAKCTYMENIELEDLYLPDRAYLAFWIRNNSFSNRNGYKLQIKECQHCKNPYEASITLENFNIQYLTGFEPSVYLPDSQLHLPISIPKFNDSLYKPVDEVESVALYINSTNTYEERKTFVENLSALDYAVLYSHLQKNSCGFQEVFEIECPHCHGTSHVRVKVNDENMFANVKLFDVLETITRISKYSNIQITNDWTWVEVELEQEVINKMIREEEQQSRKEIAKAKANSHVPPTPHIPHI